jgi:hypothetical protein
MEEDSDGGMCKLSHKTEKKENFEKFLFYPIIDYDAYNAMHKTAMHRMQFINYNI